MPLIPIDQYKSGPSRQQKTLRIAPLPSKAPEQKIRPDVRQSENYRRALAEADRYAQEAKKVSSLSGLARNTLAGIPKAGFTVGKEAITHPINTARSVASGIYGGAIAPLVKLPTYAIPGGRNIRTGLDTIGDAIAGQQNQTQQGIRGGFKFAGAVAPYQAAASLAAKALPQAPKTAQLLGWLGGGQLAYEGENTLQGRGKQAMTDALLFGLTKAAGAGIHKLKTLPRKPQTVPVETSPSLATRPIQPVESPLPTKANQLKQRGLISTIRNSPEYSTDMSRALSETTQYSRRSQMPMVRQAQKTIAKNMAEAERIATTELSDRATIMSDELLKHYDSIAQYAKKNGDKHTFDIALNRAKSLALQTDVNLRESGRAISAANRFNKQSPEGMLRTLHDIAEQKGAQLNLTNEQIFNFQRRAEEITKILDPKERALATFELMDKAYENIPAGAKDRLYEVLNLPRAMMATADVSAPLRQGIFTAARHPIIFAKNFARMFKYAFSEKQFRNLKADIVTSPNYELYVQNKLPLTDISAGLNMREEQFISQLSEKIPLFGALSRGSNRAYVGFLNKMRTDLFDNFVKTAHQNNITDPKFLSDAARFVGAATGRGDIHQLFGGNQAGKLWASFFFAPRLMSSRMSLLNPVYYAKLHPAVRKEALQSLATFVGTGMTVLGLAKLNGANVGTDPRSADFGKIKIGNTRYDVWGGFQQYARLIGQLVTGEKVSTITGKQTQLGSGYGAPTHESIIMDFLKSKEAPLLSLLTRASQGEQYGEPFRPVPEAINRFIPLVLQDAYELIKERGWAGLGMSSPALFGVGVQHYGNQIPLLEKTPTGKPTIHWRQEPTLGEDIYNQIIGKDISSVPQELWQPLSEERQQDTLRRMEIDAAKARVLETGKTETIGDTFVYLKDGIVRTKKLGKDQRTPLKDRVLFEALQQEQSTKPFFTP